MTLPDRPTFQTGSNEEDLEQLDRDSRKKVLTQILSRVGTDFINSDRASGLEIYIDRNVHAFIRSAQSPSRVIHIQAYPGFSDVDSMCILVREMDYRRLMEIRANALTQGGPSLGNEHEAVTRTIFEQGSIPSSDNSLISLLVNELPFKGVIIDGTAVEIK